MENNEHIWIEELGLQKSDFNSAPEGENLLAWAFKNDLVKESAYQKWASAHYQTPAIKPDFFAMGVDFSLIEKFSKTYSWSEICFPIYKWEDTLFVACLSPVDLADDNICFVISPYSQMVTAWQKSHKNNLVKDTVPHQINEPDQVSPPVDELDFSSLQATITPSESVEVLPEEIDIPQFDTGQVTLERTAEINPMIKASELIAKSDNVNGEDVLQSEMGSAEELKLKADAIQLAQTQSEIKVSPVSPTLQIPETHAITDQDLNVNSQMSTTKSFKGTVAHIFYHLRKDYQQLMWVEKNEDNQYRPRFCYGKWSIAEGSLQLPVNIKQPNIFKIAHSSAMPFHGEISDNPFNDKYYALWLQNQKPDFATLYPIKDHEVIVGFLVGFSKAEEFQEVDSLRKIENLISLCKEQFTVPLLKQAS